MNIKHYASVLVMIFALAGCGGNPSAPPFSQTSQSLSSATPGLPQTPLASGNMVAQWFFESDPLGGLPSGAEVFSGNWVVQAESDAPTPPHVLCQIGQATFPALSLSSTANTNLVLSVRFKPISGTIDQAAGVLFRIQDKDNYYIVRANALENNVSIFKYSGGTRSLIKEGSAPVVSGKWQTLRIEATGNLIRGYLDHQLVVEANDESYKAGKVGLWTKADSVTCFDNVQVSIL